MKVSKENKQQITMEQGKAKAVVCKEEGVTRFVMFRTEWMSGLTSCLPNEIDDLIAVLQAAKDGSDDSGCGQQEVILP
jgi:hypothetical protein